MKTFKNQFIVLDGTEENLNKAIEKAEELWYVENPEWLKWHTSEKNILDLDKDWYYFLSNSTKEVLLKAWYEELSLDTSPHYVYVSYESVEDALESKHKVILLHDLWEQFTNRYISVADFAEERYLKWEKDIDIDYWEYIAEISSDEDEGEDEEKTTLTLQEIADKFGVDKSSLLIKE